MRFALFSAGALSVIRSALKLSTQFATTMRGFRLRRQSQERSKWYVHLDLAREEPDRSVSNSLGHHGSFSSGKISVAHEFLVKRRIICLPTSLPKTPPV
jgi:hypothetical protein